MRLRNIRGSREMIAASKYTIEDDSVKGASFEERGSWSVKGNWNRVFGNDHPVRIEIGMGKGAFLMEQAGRNPDVNFVGIEKYSSVLLRAVQKQEQEQLPNVRLIRMEAENICDVFAPGEAERIYLNFSDPWPKAAHAGRRLTSAQFLERYDRILRDGGTIEFKTDNQELFDFSIESVKESNEAAHSRDDEEVKCPGSGGPGLTENGREAADAGFPGDHKQEKWQIAALTRDLHNDPVLNQGNVMTEYERRWSEEGKAICAMHLVHHSM